MTRKALYELWLEYSIIQINTLHLNARTNLTISMMRAFRAFGRFSVSMPQFFCSLTRTTASEVDDMALPIFEIVDLPDNVPLGKRDINWNECQLAALNVINAYINNLPCWLRNTTEQNKIRLHYNLLKWSGFGLNYFAFLRLLVRTESCQVTSVNVTICH